jgi:hypothetical protein
MVPPHEATPPLAYVTRVEGDGLVLQAALLTKDQSQRLLRVDAAARGVVPLLFVLSNKTTTTYTLRREHFRLRVNQEHLEPALPGRAATLLRDASGSRRAAWAGLLAIGILAAPGIDAAEKKETAAVVANREIIFSVADIPAGEMTAGYLFFEIFQALGKAPSLALELHVVSAGTSVPLMVELLNPYAN